MTTYANTAPRRRRERANSSSAFAGVIGLPDPGCGPRLHDGGLRTFARQFNERFDQLAETTRPEWRSFARAERETRSV